MSKTANRCTASAATEEAETGPNNPGPVPGAPGAGREERSGFVPD
jgi:hypothetical protein